MAIYEITFSPTGGTKKVSRLLKSAWKTEAKEIDLMNRNTDFSKYEFQEEDISFVAVPSYGGRIPAPAAERLKQLKGNGSRAVLLVVYGNRAYDDTLLELSDILTADGFVCRGACTAVAEHSILRQFAAGRPDAMDETELKVFSEQLKHSLEHETDGELDLPGKRPYVEFGGLPMVPKAGKGCTECGACVSHCPTGAIKTPKETDKELCIACMGCIAVCPEHVRSVNPILLKGAGMKMKKALSGRKPNELFLPKKKRG